METLQLIRHIGRVPEIFAARRQTTAASALLKRYLRIGAGAYPFQVALSGGGSLTLSDAEEVKVFWQIFVRGTYQLPLPCETILDCGANVGIFSVWAARQRPNARIVALEPFPRTYSALEANVRANRLEHRVRPVPMGLAATAGERQIRIEGDSPNRQLVLAGAEDMAEATVAVQCIDLAECLRQHQLGAVDLLKMDIEGSEWEVLLSTSPSVLRRFRHIQLEYHEVNARFGYTPEQLFAHLESAGHRLAFRREDSNRTGTAYFARA